MKFIPSNEYDTSLKYVLMRVSSTQVAYKQIDRHKKNPITDYE